MSTEYRTTCPRCLGGGHDDTGAGGCSKCGGDGYLTHVSPYQVGDMVTVLMEIVEIAEDDFHIPGHESLTQLGGSLKVAIHGDPIPGSGYWVGPEEVEKHDGN